MNPLSKLKFLKALISTFNKRILYMLMLRSQINAYAILLQLIKLKESMIYIIRIYQFTY